MRIIETMKDLFFVYDTPKILHFPSKALGTLNRLIQLTVAVYILVYVIGIEKGYQSKDQVVSAVSAKVKGVVKTEFSQKELVGVPKEFVSHYNRIWDVTDIVFAETASQGFFVVTNLVITPDQTRKTCPEDPSVEGSACRCPGAQTTCSHDQTKAARASQLRSTTTARALPKFKPTFFTRMTNKYTPVPATKKTPTPRYTIIGRNKPTTVTKKSINLLTSCRKGDANIPHSTGIKTGVCNARVGTCEIEAWCPVERDKLPMANKALLEDTKKFTVLIKNQISFPNFGFKTRNIKDTSNEQYLENCRYNNKTQRFCPVFELDTIVKETGADYSELAIKGGVIQVGIHWDCNVDRRDREKHCRPEYKFSRLDNPKFAAEKIGGWNYRYADYFTTNRRVLHKAYGINFIINVYGEARQFDIVPTMRNIGAGLGLMALSSFICNRIIDILRVTQKTFNEEFEFVEFDKAQRTEFEQSQNYQSQEDDTSL